MIAKFIEQAREVWLNVEALSCSCEDLALYPFGAIKSLDGRVLRKNGADRVVITLQSRVRTNGMEVDARRLGSAQSAAAEMPQTTDRQAEERKPSRSCEVLRGAGPSQPIAVIISTAFGTPDALWVGV